MEIRAELKPLMTLLEPRVLSTKVSTMAELSFELVKPEFSKSLMFIMAVRSTVRRRKALDREFGLLVEIAEVSMLKEAFVFKLLICDPKAFMPALFVFDP